MLNAKLVFAAAAFVFAATGTEAQVMSNKTTNNPSTSGYAASATGNTHASADMAKDTHKRIHGKKSADLASNPASAGTSPAETAGASSAAGSPGMKKDATQSSR